MRRIFCLMLMVTCPGCSSNADEEARKAKLAEKEARQAKVAAEEARQKQAANEEMHKTQAARVQAETLSMLAKKFYIDHGQYPQALHELVQTPQPGGNGGSYCKPEALRDPWRQEFQYDVSGPKTMMAGGEGPDIYSKGNPAAPKQIGSWMPMPKR